MKIYSLSDFTGERVDEDRKNRTDRFDAIFLTAGNTTNIHGSHPYYRVKHVFFGPIVRRAFPIFFFFLLVV